MKPLRATTSFDSHKMKKKSKDFTGQRNLFLGPPPEMNAIGETK